MLRHSHFVESFLLYKAYLLSGRTAYAKNRLRMHVQSVLGMRSSQIFEVKCSCYDVKCTVCGSDMINDQMTWALWKLFEVGTI